MLRSSNSCPALKDAFTNAKAGTRASPARTADPHAAQATKRKMPKQTDFPCPPKSVEIAFDFQSSPMHYEREGPADDASSAVLGTGAFGAAYRYVKVTPAASTGDDSLVSSQSTQASSSRMHGSHLQDFTSPPTSMDEEILQDGIGSAPKTHNGRRRPGTGGSNTHGDASSPRAEPIEAVDKAGGTSGTEQKPGQRLVVPSQGVSRSRSRSVLRSAASLPMLKQAAQQSMLTETNHAELRPSDDKHHHTIVIKLCRTPISGSFDELPRTQRGAATKPKAGWHIRIVRGEGRLFRYLQKAQALQVAHLGGKTPTAAQGFIEAEEQLDTYTVRLLADLPADGHVQGQIFNLTPQSSAGNSLSLMSSAVRVQDMDSHSRPPYRMLAFEELVDLDAECVDGTWTKGTHAWTAQQVESAAKETALGLKFLHAHGIVHSDLKPANLMRDPRTGVVKLIDLGAARRFVRIEDQFKHSTTIVEERDAAMNSAEEEAAILRDTYCEGLTSLTGSPHFMAPEILLQAARYTDKDGISRSTLKDYKRNPQYLPPCQSSQWLRRCIDDYALGWGIKADIWSWGCCVLSFLVRMLAPFKDRNNTALICPFDFTFDDNSDALHPLHELGPSEKNLPHFHLWARIYPLRIQDIVAEGARITVKAQECMSPSLTQMVIASLRHHSIRPTAVQICEALMPPQSRPAMRPVRHSYAEIPHTRLTDTPKTLPESLTDASDSSASASHHVSRPITGPAQADKPSATQTASSAQAAIAARRLETTSKEMSQDGRGDLRKDKDTGRLTDRRRSAPMEQGKELPGSEAEAAASVAGKCPGSVPLKSDHGTFSSVASALGLQLSRGHPGAEHTVSPSKERSAQTKRNSSRSHKEPAPPSSPARDGLDVKLLTPPDASHDAGKKERSSLRRRLSKVSNLNLRLSNMVASMGSRSHSSNASQLASATTYASNTSEKRLSSKSAIDIHGGASSLNEPVELTCISEGSPARIDNAKLAPLPPPPPPIGKSPWLSPGASLNRELMDDDRSCTESLLSSNHGPVTPQNRSTQLAETPSPTTTGLSPFTASESATSPSSIADGSPRPKRSVESPAFKLSCGDGTRDAIELDDQLATRARTQSGHSLVDSLKARASSLVRRAKHPHEHPASPSSPAAGAKPEGHSGADKTRDRRLTSESLYSTSSSFGTGLGQGVEAMHNRKVEKSGGTGAHARRQSARSSKLSLEHGQEPQSPAEVNRSKARFSTGASSLLRSQAEDQGPAPCVEKVSAVDKISQLMRRGSLASISSRIGGQSVGGVNAAPPPLPDMSGPVRFSEDGSSSPKGKGSSKNILGLGIRLGPMNSSALQSPTVGSPSPLRNSPSFSKLSQWYSNGPLSPSRAHHQVNSLRSAGLPPSPVGPESPGKRLRGMGLRPSSPLAPSREPSWTMAERSTLTTPSSMHSDKRTLKGKLSKLFLR